MTKRRINKQQAVRIKKIQADYQVNPSDRVFEGLVITRFSRHAEIETTDARRIRCSIRPNIDSLVAGDRVIWQMEGDHQGIVVSCYPRSSMLGRPDKRGQYRAVAANITQLVVVVAVKPEVSFALLDSYLIMAEQLNLNVVIVLNKIDLPSHALQEQLLAIYKPLHYPLLFVSKEQHQGYDELKELLNNQTSVFVGQSGVGKSSLIAEILPHEQRIQTGEISAISELGCHTTSNSRLYHLLTGGSLIDSPGVREFGLWNVSSLDIIRGYKELRQLSIDCKFRNCNHIDSPACAIIAAVEAGTVSKLRYDNFLKLVAQYNPSGN